MVGLEVASNLLIPPEPPCATGSNPETEVVRFILGPAPADVPS